MIVYKILQLKSLPLLILSFAVLILASKIGPVSCTIEEPQVTDELPTIDKVKSHSSIVHEYPIGYRTSPNKPIPGAGRWKLKDNNVWEKIGEYK